MTAEKPASRVKVKAGKAPRKTPTKPLVVYYKMCGTDNVHSTYLDHRCGKNLIMTDGGHNPARRTYLTPEQAAAEVCNCVSCRAHRLVNSRCVVCDRFASVDRTRCIDDTEVEGERRHLCEDCSWRAKHLQDSQIRLVAAATAVFDALRSGRD